ncbi:MAG: hypothetical protein KKH60_08490 [Proteobacteria bacterium]|nr:hypothetical protein [Pseudomonadota bacterium]
MIYFIFISNISFAREIDGNQLTFVNPGVNANTNIHFSKYYCNECHLNAEGQGDVDMRFDDFIETCRCHNYTPENYTHPVGIKLSPEKRAKIPSDFPLKDSTITCVTCHRMSLQCQTDSSMKKFNSSFLRINPLMSRTAICYQCHSEAKYKMMDPHNQIDKEGNVVKEKCLYCHKGVPDVNRATLADPHGMGDLVAPIGKLDVLCYRCHYKQIQLHPINANHLKKPPAAILKNMRRSERKLGIILPLDAQGKVTCVTCHNPHERGVIPADKTGAGGAGEAGRLRVSRGGDKICLACHQNN